TVSPRETRERRDGGRVARRFAEAERRLEADARIRIAGESKDAREQRAPRLRHPDRLLPHGRVGIAERLREELHAQRTEAVEGPERLDPRRSARVLERRAGERRDGG